MHVCTYPQVCCLIYIIYNNSCINNQILLRLFLKCASLWLPRYIGTYIHRQIWQQVVVSIAQCFAFAYT